MKAPRPTDAGLAACPAHARRFAILLAVASLSWVAIESAVLIGIS